MIRQSGQRFACLLCYFQAYKRHPMTSYKKKSKEYSSKQWNIDQQESKRPFRKMHRCCWEEIQRHTEKCISFRKKDNKDSLGRPVSDWQTVSAHFRFGEESLDALVPECGAFCNISYSVLKQLNRSFDFRRNTLCNSLLAMADFLSSIHSSRLCF